MNDLVYFFCYKHIQDQPRLNGGFSLLDDLPKNRRRHSFKKRRYPKRQPVFPGKWHKAKPWLTWFNGVSIGGSNDLTMMSENRAIWQVHYLYWERPTNNFYCRLRFCKKRANCWERKIDIPKPNDDEQFAIFDVVFEDCDYFNIMEESKLIKLRTLTMTDEANSSGWNSNDQK